MSVAAPTSRPACDVAIIGAGPAGLAAAIGVADAGLDVVLIDDQTAPGGQIYRAITTTPVRDRGVLGDDYWHGERLVERFAASATHPMFDTTLWAIERNADGFALATSSAGIACLLQARHVILATGAHERPFPIQGWTLPGVMAAGAAQIMLKASGLVPDAPVVLAGCGPLLYLIAAQYAAAGVRIECVLDTTMRRWRTGSWRDSLGTIAQFVRSPYVAKGWSLLRRAKSRTVFVHGVTQLRALGNGRLEHVEYACGKRRAVVAARVLLLHQGVVPGINLSNAAGCAHHWDPAQVCFVPNVDAWGASSVPGITIAGDAAGIAGARAAEVRGSLAALHATSVLGRIDYGERDAAGAALMRQLHRWTRGRRFLDLRFMPPAQFRIPSGDTVVCRCEEITAQQVADALEQGCAGPNQMKAFLRAGMGPCQGRMCGLTVTEMIAHARGISPTQAGYYRLRFPTRPVTLGELASLPKTEAALAAVVRINHHDHRHQK